MDIQLVQLLLGPSSNITTEIHTYVANKSFMDIKNILS